MRCPIRSAASRNLAGARSPTPPRPPAISSKCCGRLPVDRHPGLRAEALIIASVARGNVDQDADAERLLLEAVDASTRARDDELAARSFIQLVSHTAKTRPRQASQTIELAEAAVTRAGRTPHLESTLLVARARVERQTDQLALAVEHLTRAVALRQAATSPDDLDVAVPLGNLANSTMLLGHLTEGYELQKRALGILERHLPENHPEIARTAENLAWAALMLGHMGDAEAGFRRTLAMNETLFGPDHAKLAGSLDGLSMALRRTGRAAEALTVAERALAIRQHALPAAHILVASSHTSVAVALIDQGRCPAALPHLQLAIDRFATAEN
jgi:tetratricopeptide (TPR) repeat protein